MVTSVDFTKAQKSRYLENKKNVFFFKQKKIINYSPRATLWQKNSFVGETPLTLNNRTLTFTRENPADAFTLWRTNE